MRDQSGRRLDVVRGGRRQVARRGAGDHGTTGPRTGGVDLASFQIEKLNRSRLAGEGVRFVHPSIDGLRFGDGELDVAWCCDVLEHVDPESVDGVLSEICRVADRAVLSIFTRPSVILEAANFRARTGYARASIAGQQ